MSVLTGPENTKDYTYLGVIGAGGRYYHGRKSKIGKEAQSNKVFEVVWDRLTKGTLPDCVEIWHEGRCGRCGRPLTDPDSIKSGIGPVCREKML